MNLHSSEEATNFRARSIAIDSALKIELADDNRRELACCQKSAADASIQMLLRNRGSKTRIGVFWVIRGAPISRS